MSRGSSWLRMKTFYCCRAQVVVFRPTSVGEKRGREYIHRFPWVVEKKASVFAKTSNEADRTTVLPPFCSRFLPEFRAFRARAIGDSRFEWFLGWNDIWRFMLRWNGGCGCGWSVVIALIGRKVLLKIVEIMFKALESLLATANTCLFTGT